MERKFRFAQGEYYHIYNRGNNKSKIFLSADADQKRFQKLLYVCNGQNPVVYKTIQGRPLGKIERGETLVDIGAYCLMPNHFHILIREKTEGGIAKFMGKLATGYSMYFNKKNTRTGALFEGKFKAKYVDSDEYLKYLFAYIHLNPVKITDPKWKDDGIVDRTGAKQFLDAYLYSSYIDYAVGPRIEALILEKSAFPDYFSNIVEFSKFVDEWLDYPRAALG